MHNRKTGFINVYDVSNDPVFPTGRVGVDIFSSEVEAKKNIEPKHVSGYVYLDTVEIAWYE